MGRRFAAASSERIYIGAAGLTSLDFQFGTMAVCMWRQSDTGAFETMISSNDGAVTGVGFNIDVSDRLNYFGNSADRNFTTTIPISKHRIVAFTKATGTTTARGHVFDFSTGTWTHSAASGTAPDSNAITTLCLGTDDNTGATGKMDAEVWAIGIWKKVVMTDSECERLARGNWLNLEPSFYEQWSDGREVGDMPRTLGRYPARQTARTGTTRGAQKPPPGFRMDARRHRR